MAFATSAKRCLPLISIIAVIQIFIIATLLDQKYTHLPDIIHIEWKEDNLQNTENEEGTFDIALLQTSPERVIRILPKTFHWQWMKTHITQLWPVWKNTVQNMSNWKSMKNRKQLNVLVLPGVLSKTNFVNLDYIKAGGPLGELVQWSDLIAALTILGHNVTLEHSIPTAIEKLSQSFTSQTSLNEAPGCFAGGPDLIYVDYLAMFSLPKNVIGAYRNRFRVLDCFGTEASHNNIKMAQNNGFDAKWAFDLHLQQFYTMYPHTPDNSFIGFVIRPSEMKVTKKENIAIIYGKKVSNILKSKIPMLEVLSKHFELHATCADSLPQFVKNHGVLTSSGFTDVLKKAKVLVGLGDPVEGPAALEAVTKGMIFINPIVPSNKNPFKGKPTSRKLTSQLPYGAEHIGLPNVITLDVSNITAVREIIPLLNKTVEPVFPYEFSMEGYLERLNYFLRYQDFCHHVEDTNLVKSLKVIKSKAGKDCVETCRDKGLVCDRALFPQINNETSHQRNTPACKEFKIKDDAVIYPSLHISSGICYLQSNPKLLSCAGSHVDHTRICPCRGYRKFQISLCETCK